MSNTFLRPGIMVSIKTNVSGGYAYDRKPLDTPEDVIPEGGAATSWQTTKTVVDPAELERAQKVRSDARKLVTKLCTRTSFGLIARKGDEARLDEAIRAARDLCKAHNAEANVSHVHVFVLKGQVASTDEEAACAIADEMRDLIAAMQQGIDRCDPEAIRDAAEKAKRLGAMLEPEQAEKVGAAIEQARKAARMITARIEKAGEDAAIVLQDIQRGAIAKARIAFLDLDDDEAPAEHAAAMPAVQVQRVAELDITGTEG